MKIRGKLLVMAAVVLAGLTILSGLAFNTNRSIEATFAELQLRSEQVELLDRLEMAQLDTRLGAMELIEAAGDGHFTQEIAEHMVSAAGIIGQLAPKLDSIADTPKERKLAAALQQDLTQFATLAENLIKKIESGVGRSSIDATDKELDRIGEASEQKLAGFIESIQGEVVAARQAVASKIETAELRLLLVALATLAVLAGAFLVFGRNLVLPLRRAAGMLRDIEQGHLETRLNLGGQDEIAEMGRTMDALAESLQQEVIAPLQQLARGDLTFSVSPRDNRDALRGSLKTLGADLNELIGQIQIAGTQIATGSTQVSDTSQSLSQGATESAASLEQITSSINEMASRTRQNAENSDKANELASQAKQTAESGNQQMDQMTEAMGEINQASQEISKIIKVIDEIAFQTNLLALNAAVEAARAGQHGKGFAVVAEEVRNLAARSATAAKETAQLIESSVSKIGNGTQIAHQTGNALGRIVSGVTEMTSLVAEISSASNEQAQGISEINNGLCQIDQVTQQNTANAEESAAASEELSGQARQLHQMLSRFRLKATCHGGQGPRIDLDRPPQPQHQALAGNGMIEWNSSLNVGISQIDAQHRQLAGMLNELFDALRAGKGRVVLERTLNALIKYTRDHFAAEERLMAEHDFPGLAEHKAAHQQLIERVAEFKAKLQQGQTSISSELFNFLKGWLIYHIQQQDQEYGPHLKSRGVN